MKTLHNPTQEQIMEEFIDITGVQHGVEVMSSGKVLWVNVDGVCLLRICQLKPGQLLTALPAAAPEEPEEFKVELENPT